MTLALHFYNKTIIEHKKVSENGHIISIRIFQWQCSKEVSRRNSFKMNNFWLTRSRLPIHTIINCIYIWTHLNTIDNYIILYRYNLSLTNTFITERQ